MKSARLKPQAEMSLSRRIEIGILKSSNASAETDYQFPDYLPYQSVARDRLCDV